MKEGLYMNFRYKLMQFMSGRNGVDGLFYAIFGVAAVLSIANCFIRSLVLQIIVYALVAFAFFRIMSRNIEARRRENQWFNKIKASFIKKRNVYRQRRADYNHVYKKCPRCHAVLRLPRRKGKHTTVCPKCSNKFKVYVFKA